MKTVKQCRSCPWRVDCEPDRDIPNYVRGLHENLDDTIAEPGDVSSLACNTLRVMACHYSKPGEVFPCAGWLHHQIGPGNNILVRLRVMTEQMPVPEIDGPQHETFEQTLCSGETPTGSSTTSSRRASPTRKSRAAKSGSSNGSGGKRASTASRRRA